MIRKIPREITIGFIAIATLALLYWGIDYLKGKSWFDNSNRYYVVYEEVDGINNQADVMLNGLKIGNVTSVEYEPDLKGILVEFSVEKKFVLPKFTIAEIYSADITGTRAIRLDLGLGKEGKHKSGDTLLPSREPSLQDRVSREMLPVKIKAEELMMEMQKVLESIKYVFNENTRENLAKSFESIKKTLINLESSSVSLDTLLGRGQGKINRILDNIASISANLRNNNDKLSNVISNFERISDTIAKAEIATTFNTAEKALNKANEIFDKINRGEGTIGLLIHNDTLYDELESAAHNLDKLLEDLRHNPKRYTHFSLFDFGRTFYVTEDEAIKEKQKDGAKEIGKVKKELQKLEDNPSKFSLEDIEHLENEIDRFESDPEMYPPEEVKKLRQQLVKIKVGSSSSAVPNNGQPIVFKVQIKSSVEQIPFGSKEFKGHDDIDELVIDGRYKYAIGTLYNLKEAIVKQEELRNDFPDAFVIALRDGEKIPITKAKKELNL